jgi:diacylglycerol kinase family enzyme
LNISLGVSSLTMHDTRRDHKRRFGLLAYLWKGAKWLTGVQPQRFTITIDGKRRRYRASEVVVANSGMLGMRPFTWGSHITLDDGQLDVCVVRARGAPDYLRVIWSTILGRQKRPKVAYLTARQSVTIDSDWPLPVQADGEIIGQTPIHVELVPKALRVVVPIPAGEQPRSPALVAKTLAATTLNKEDNRK